MPKIEQQILEYLQRPGYKPRKPKSLAKKLGVTKKKMPAFQRALDELIESGQIVQNKNELVRIRESDALIAGTVKRIGSGAGFFIPHDRQAAGLEADLYITPKDMGDAHTGDEVLCRLLKRRGKGGRRCGRVEEIIERATSDFVGVYFEEAGLGYVQIDGSAFPEPVFVGDPGAKGAQPGDKVLIEMLRFPSQHLEGEAVLTEVLGPRGKPGVDVLSIIYEFGLPQEFPEEVLEESRLEADRFDENDLEDRLDLTGETIVTIDPKDARDFDDAISLSRDEQGHWRLGVHIADVAHFVTPGGALDREAKRRGTSVYLPGRVIPMLPEVVSNGLASLQMGRLRYTKSVFIEFDPSGIPLHTEFARSAIRVTKRLTYEQVLPIIQQQQQSAIDVSDDVRRLLGRMHELAMLLRKRRWQAGALELYLPEVELEFTKDGRVKGAHDVVHDESHQIIEEFMLAANIAVATKLSDRSIPFLRRVHADPDLRKFEAFARFVKALGFRIKQHPGRKELQSLLADVRGEPTEHAINFALLKSMKQAEYTPFEEGHFALAEENYCHFTSPIRRYPDLTIHRLVDDVVLGRSRRRKQPTGELVKLGTLCSRTERRAQGAERELTKIKLLTFMADRIGEEFDARVTGVERFGLFCRGVDMPVEGFTHISWLSEFDRFDFDADAMALVGRRRGTTYRLGDLVRVRVAHVDVDRRELDLHVLKVLTGAPSKRKPKKKRSPKKKKRPAKKESPSQKKSKAKKTTRRGGRRKKRSRRK